MDTSERLMQLDTQRSAGPLVRPSGENNALDICLAVCLALCRIASL